MRIKYKTILLSLAALCIILCVGCGDKRDADAPYTSGYDPAKLVTITQAEGYPDLKFPVNQLVVYTEDSMTRQEFLNLIDNMEDIKLIGQVPSIGFYQLEVKAQTTAELDQIKSSLLAVEGIEGATYNLLYQEHIDVGSCPVLPDVGLDNVSEDDRLPYWQTDYYTALEIMQGVRDLITMHDVTIGIMESGYSPNREFDDITITNVSERDARGERIELVSTSAHGTAVSGIICGDNDAQGINGIASTLVGDHLHVVMANRNLHSAISTCAAIESAIIDGGADIINCSFGFGPFYDPSGPVATGIIAAFTNIMNHHPDVLFVSSAGNGLSNQGIFGLEITGDNSAPGGIRLNNSLTVTSWDHNNPAVRCPGFNYGAVVDMSAPGDRIRIVKANGDTEISSGTSLSVPMVVSAAALLKSIGGDSLSPQEIKNLLLNPTFHAVRTDPGGGIQLTYSYPLVDLLWQQYQGDDWAEKYLSGESEGQHTVPKIVATRICEEPTVEVAEFGTFTMNEADPCRSGVSMFLAPDGSTWSIAAANLKNESNDRIDVAVNNATRQFAIDSPYEITPSSIPMTCIITDHDLIDNSCRRVDAADGDFRYQGGCTSGSFVFTNCSVTQRTPDGLPKYLSLEIRFYTSVEGILWTYYPSDPTLPIDIQEKNTTMSGSLQNVMVLTVDPMGTFSQAVEDACLSGTLITAREGKKNNQQ